MGWAKEGIFPFSHKEPVTGGGAFEPKANYSILNCKCAILQLKMALCWQTLTEHLSTKIYMMTVKRWTFRVPAQRDKQWGFPVSLSFLTCAHIQSHLIKNLSFSEDPSWEKTEGDFFSLVCPPTQRSGLDCSENMDAVSPLDEFCSVTLPGTSSFPPCPAKCILETRSGTTARQAVAGALPLASCFWEL